MFHAGHDIGLKRVPFLDQLIHALGQLTINSPPRKLILFAKAIAVKEKWRKDSRRGRGQKSKVRDCRIQ